MTHDPDQKNLVSFDLRKKRRLNETVVRNRLPKERLRATAGVVPASNEATDCRAYAYILQPLNSGNGDMSPYERRCRAAR